MIAFAPQGAPPANDNATRQGGAGGFAKQTDDKLNASAPGHKWATVLRYLLDLKSLNRFEAERRVNDHCLHSTVSYLKREFGIEIDRVFETVPALQGRATARVCRYWLHPTPENLKRARAVLGMREGVAQ